VAQIQLLVQNNDSANYYLEVDLMVHAHFSYLVASNISGGTFFSRSYLYLNLNSLFFFTFVFKVQMTNSVVENVIQIIGERVPLYVRLKEFKLLVRLLTGTKEYSRLEYILDELMKNGIISCLQLQKFLRLDINY
jgi:hypothetical protein